MVDKSGVDSSQHADDFFLPNLCTVQAVFILILIAELFAVILTLATSGVRFFNWENLALTSLFVQWVVLVSAAVLCQLRPLMQRLPLIMAAAAGYCLILVITLLLSVAAQWVMGDWKANGFDWSPLLTHLIISAIVSGMAMRYFYVRYLLRRQEQAELQYRIQALQSRIRPHFLFNSMNIIASLIEVDPETAETVVVDLSELFRASLHDVGNQVSLKEELGLCERYVRIESLRLGDRLKVDWQIGEIPDAVKIPMLTLQPLLENAIYHGIQPLPEGGLIEVVVKYDAPMLRIKITNPRVPAGAEQHTKGNRMALDNIRSRLDALYGAEAFVASEIDGELYVTTLSYPFEQENLATVA